MKKKLILTVFVGILVVVGIYLVAKNRNIEHSSSNLTAPKTVKIVEPSSTAIDYTDPSGFSFSYPDNISISFAEKDESTYTDLQLFSKDVSGSLNLKIADSKLKSMDDWLEENKIADTAQKVSKKLGNLDAVEVKTSDRLLLGALDQGVLFTIEMPLIEQVFWAKVYDKLLTDFTFAAPVAVETGSTSTTSSDEVIFEGEEVIE